MGWRITHALLLGGSDDRREYAVCLSTSGERATTAIVGIGDASEYRPAVDVVQCGDESARAWLTDVLHADAVTAYCTQRAAA